MLRHFRSLTGLRLRNSSNRQVWAADQRAAYAKKGAEQRQASEMEQVMLEVSLALGIEVAM